MEELRIPKRAVPVDITRSDGTRFEAEVYLAEFSPAHAGGERLSEMLNAGPFLPARDVKQNKLHFLNCRRVAVARVARDIEADDDAAAHTIPTEHEVRVMLSSGQTLQGLITYLLPPERSRLIDFLNAAPLFIPLVEADHLALINRDLVVEIEALNNR